MSQGYCDGLPMELGCVRQGIDTENCCGETSRKTPNWKTEKKSQGNMKWNLERQAVKMGGEQNWFKIIYSNNLTLPIELSGSASSQWLI